MIIIIIISNHYCNHDVVRRPDMIVGDGGDESRWLQILRRSPSIGDMVVVRRQVYVSLKMVGELGMGAMIVVVAVVVVVFRVCSAEKEKNSGL